MPSYERERRIKGYYICSSLVFVGLLKLRGEICFFKGQLGCVALPKGQPHLITKKKKNPPLLPRTRALFHFLLQLQHHKSSLIPHSSA